MFFTGKKLHGKWVLVRMGGKAANESQAELAADQGTRRVRTDSRTIEPITEKAPNSVLTQRDMDAIAREGDHVWQSNRPETSSGGKSSPRQEVDSLRPLRSARQEGSSARIYSTAVSLGGSCHRPVGEHWVHELKLDGYRIQAHIDKSGKVRLYTRSGLDWTHRMPSVAREVGKLSVESAILDGEVVVLSADGQSSFAKLQAAFEEGATHPLTYFVFDLLHLNGHNLRQQPLTERKDILQQMLESLAEHESVRYGQHIQTEGEPIFDAACRIGAEGIVSKRSDSTYTSGRTQVVAQDQVRSAPGICRWRLHQADQRNGRYRSPSAGVLRRQETDLCGAHGHWFYPGQLAQIAPAIGGDAANAHAFRGRAGCGG